MVIGLDKLAKLDELDIKILSLLMENSRISLNKIAERLGISVATASARVKKLESLGVIERYTIYINCRKLGFQGGAILLIKVRKDVDDVVKKLKDFPEIKFIYRVAGAYDLCVCVTCTDVDSLSKVLDKIQGIENVIETQKMVLLDILMERCHPHPKVLRNGISMALGKKD